MRILLVEDNVIVRALICELLEHEDREFVDCGSAEQAERAFDEQNFDIVLTDINLPVTSGIELARRLLNKRSDLWIVFTSSDIHGYELEDLGSRVRLLAKPFDVSELNRLIAQVSCAP